ncbi:MAG TPA: F0F1 ATP synthase subunit A [Pyrinomonadaceae bacterium]|jgi:F-type H+-transporting ATPase subunit a|nr:F0F1 ATP synthase subunit A [Pyrinomonadaceae bacterium]
MFWLFSEPETAAKAAEHGGKAAEHAAESGGGHHTPLVVEFLNQTFGKPVHEFQVAYTKPAWDWFFHYFGTTAENVFGAYTPENAIPWYTVMFVLACIFTMALIWILMPRQPSEDDPPHSQLTLEAGVLGIRSLLEDNVGPHGLKYFPVVATFGLLILISNLMGLIPGLMSPTAATSVTFALGISSFVYYNAVGIRENGLMGHLKHFAGPIIWLAPLMFPIELISNFVRPLSLGIRLFGNLFGDEQVLGTVGTLATDLTGALGLPAGPWLLPVIIMPLSLFVAFMQTFIFVLLSIIYLGEVSHGSHDDHDEEGERGHAHGEGGIISAPAHT